MERVVEHYFNGVVKVTICYENKVFEYTYTKRSDGTHMLIKERLTTRRRDKP